MKLNLKKLRKDNKISQEYLADKLCVSRPTYTQIENGEKDLTLEQYRILQELFGPSLNDKYYLKQSKQKNRIKLPKTDSKKYKEVILYILKKIGAMPNIGESVIYKILYFIDFNYFEKYGKFLIGESYQKNHFGPTPIHFKKITDEMIENNELEKMKSKYFQYDQKKYLPLREPDFEVLKDSREIKFIDEILDKLANLSASELSNFSHGDVPWMATDDQEIIDYNFVFERTAPYSYRNYDEEILKASYEDILKELGPISKEEMEYYNNL